MSDVVAPVVDRRFEAAISLAVTETKDGKQVPFCNVVLTYHNLPYDGLCLVENVLMGGLTQLTDAGIKKAMVMGLTDRLAAMLPEKMKEFV